ncbi:hypothetical protein MHBO_001455 [Bonamia ostreae]|uniref:Uncharacterized protein n=1 Tax=Bonamia ostreae TaxID=126728 RepID=A0ABV2AJM9_9EUKA
MYKLFTNDKKLKPGIAYKIIDLETLNSSPFESFGNFPDFSANKIENALSNNSFNDRLELKNVSKKLKITKKFFFVFLKIFLGERAQRFGFQSVNGPNNES